MLVVNSGHQLFKLPFVVRNIVSQRPRERDSQVFSVFSDDYEKPRCIPWCL